VTSVVGPASAHTEETIAIQTTIANQGMGRAWEGFYVRVYLSEDSEITTDDVALGTRYISGQAAGTEVTYNLGGTIPRYSAGTYYVGAIVDYTNGVQDETDETNNALAYGPICIDTCSPVDSAGGPYNVPEGGAVILAGIGGDPNGDPLTYAWDLDNDGVFEMPGQSPVFSAANLDGPSVQPIAVQVTDSSGQSVVYETTVTVLNVAPTAAFAFAADTVVEGQPVTLHFADPLDPGAADVAAGLTYSFDCTGDGTFEASDVADMSFGCFYPTEGAFSAKGRIADKDGGHTDYVAAITVIDAGTDLAVQSSDIAFAPPNPGAGEIVTIQVEISYRGLSDASDVQVSFFDADTQIAQAVIPTLSSGEIAQVAVEATFQDAGVRLIKVVVDPDNAVAESDEGNNEASQLLQVGESDPSGAVIVVEATSLSTCQGRFVAVTGRADYDFAAVPGEQDHPVQGGKVTVKVVNPATGSVIALFTGAHTNVNGYFGQGILAPDTDGTYTLRIEVTDQTTAGQAEATPAVSGTCPTPPPAPPPSPSGGPSAPPAPNTPPRAVQDVYVLSEDIYFSDENPDNGETITVLAYVHYYGSEPASDIPVTIYDIFPIGGVLTAYKVGSTLVSYPDAGGSSPVVVGVPWTNSQEGAHVIQVVAEPAFAQFVKNDQATRSIFVGTPPQVSISKDFALWIDADGNGVASPGDTIQYTVGYENYGAVDITGVTIIDDYDETLVGSPFDVSDVGVVSDGNITWALGTLAAGQSGSVTYSVDIKPRDEFPTGRTAVANVALLISDQTPPVAATATVEVVANMPPTVDAGGMYGGDEGSAIPLDGATASDPDQDSLTFVWSVDSALCALSEPGILNPTLTCTDNGSYVVTLTVSDGINDPVSSNANVTVTNVAPEIDGLAAPADPVAIDSQPVSVEVTFGDPGLADTYVVGWDWGDGSIGTQQDANSPVSQDHTYAQPGVYKVTVTVTDDDGGTDTASYEFIVIYDPDGGFVTGSGWIDSPAGAYSPNPALEGKAHFGFVSRYQKGATVPTGNTAFQFQVADLRFQSDTYEWLVVAGSKAQFKGLGTVNGNGNYGFLLTAVDAELSSGADVDRFRIKIWDVATDQVIYDNQLGDDDAVDPATEIGGGSIVIHK